MNRIKVLHVVPEFGTGGAERLVVDLLTHQDKEAFDVCAVSLYAAADTIYEQELKEKGANVIFLDKKSGPDVSIIKKIRDVIRSFQPDVIHTCRYVVRYTMIPASREKVPVRVHTVQNIAEKELSRSGQLIMKLAYGRFGHQPVAISEEVKASIDRVYGNMNAPIIRNAVALDIFDANGTERKPDPFVFVSVGRFMPQKNHPMLLSAFKRVLESAPTCRLQLVGDGALMEETRQKAAELNIQDNVEFTGIRKDIPDLLAAANAFVLSSDWEGLPLSLLEAMASGLPVVSTDVGGVRDAVGDQALLVEKGDDEALANAMLQLVNDAALYKNLAAASLERVQLFDIDTCQKAYGELYRSLLNKEKDA